jgi:hypothetical protein
VRTGAIAASILPEDTAMFLKAFSSIAEQIITTT